MIAAIVNHPFWTMTVLVVVCVAGLQVVRVWDTEWVIHMLSKVRPSKRFFTYRSGHGRHAINGRNYGKFATA